MSAPTPQPEPQPQPEVKPQAATPESKRELISPRSDNADLRYKFWHLTIQAFSLAVAIGAWILVLRSLENNTKSVRASVRYSMLNQLSGLTKMYLDKPTLYPYFHAAKVPDPKSPEYQDAMVAATHLADVMDVVADQNDLFKDDPYQSPQAWDQWVRDTLKNSPILRENLGQHCKWYSDLLIRKLREVDPTKCP